MKHVVVICILLAGLFIGTPASATPPTKGKMYAWVNADEVKLFRQAGTSAEVLRILNRTDKLQVLRAHNKTWSIIIIDDLVGYVLTSELNWKPSYTLYANKGK